MSKANDFILQVWVEDRWINYTREHSLARLIYIWEEELFDCQIRILCYIDKTWTEILISGSKLKISNQLISA